MNTSSNSALAQQGSPARQTEVQGSHDMLHKNCEELSMVVADLETRLHPVLAQRAETVDAKTSQPEPLRVPIAQMFYDRSAQVNLNIIALRSILDRLEV